MWVLLLGLIAAFVLFILPSESRRALAWVAAAIVGWLALYAIADIRRSFREIKESEAASKLIALGEVKVDDLQLIGTTPATYEMRGLLHNLSSTHTLTLTRFTFVVQDCVALDNCQEQARGRAEVGHDVKPKQTVYFSTRTVRIEGERGLLPPRGQRRLTANVSLTTGQ